MEAVEDLVKICPACKEENPVSEVICRVCMSNLTSVSPTRKGEGAIQPDAGERTCRASAPAVLTLSRLSDGRVLPVSDGGVLGRSGESGAFFERDRTVSRQHAKVGFRDGVWHIEDLNSTNGTWVNGKRLAPGRPSPLNAGDLIALSLACELNVI